jgi:hypothetical protein
MAFRLHFGGNFAAMLHERDGDQAMQWYRLSRSSPHHVADLGLC